MINTGVGNIYSCKKRWWKQYTAVNIKKIHHTCKCWRAKLVLCILHYTIYICVNIPFLFGFQAHVSDSISLWQTITNVGMVTKKTCRRSFVIPWNIPQDVEAARFTWNPKVSYKQRHDPKSINLNSTDKKKFYTYLCNLFILHISLS